MWAKSELKVTLIELGIKVYYRISWVIHDMYAKEWEVRPFGLSYQSLISIFLMLLCYPYRITRIRPGRFLRQSSTLILPKEETQSKGDGGMLNFEEEGLSLNTGMLIYY